MSATGTRRSKRKAEEPAKAPAAAEKPALKKSSKKKQKKETVEPESCHDIFMKEVAVREKQLKKHCIIMEMVDTDEDETTLEQLRALKRVFVPKKVQNHFIEIWSELDDVGADDDDEDGEGEEGEEADATMKAFMMMMLGKCLTTKHAEEMQTILRTHLDTIDESIKSETWQDAFCRWVATAMAARREPHWWEDTDLPDDALTIYERLRQQWFQLKDRTDEELGGLVCDIPGVSVITELTQYFQDLADEMKQLDYQVEDVVVKPQKRVKQTVALQMERRKEQKRKEKEERKRKEKEEEHQAEQEIKPQQVKGKKEAAKKQQADEDAGKVTAAAAKPKKKQKQEASAAAVQGEVEGERKSKRQAGVKAVEQVEQPTKKHRGDRSKQEAEADGAGASQGKKHAASDGAAVKQKPEKRKTGKGKSKQ